MTAIKDSSGEILNAKESSLHPALHRMKEAVWIRVDWVTKENGKQMRIYQLTAGHRKQLAEAETRWHTVSSVIHGVMREA